MAFNIDELQDFKEFHLNLEDYLSTPQTLKHLNQKSFYKKYIKSFNNYVLYKNH